MTVETEREIVCLSLWRTISAKNQTSHFIHNFSFDIQFFAFDTQLFKSHTIHFLFDLQLCQFYIQLRLQHNFSYSILKFTFDIQPQSSKKCSIAGSLARLQKFYFCTAWLLVYTILYSENGGSSRFNRGEKYGFKSR